MCVCYVHKLPVESPVVYILSIENTSDIRKLELALPQNIHLKVTYLFHIGGVWGDTNPGLPSTHHSAITLFFFHILAFIGGGCVVLTKSGIFQIFLKFIPEGKLQ